MKTLTASPALGVLLCLAALPRPVAAQGGEWPTLRQLGVEYISRSGGVQVSLSGQLDLETLYDSNSWSSLVSLEGGTDVLQSTPEDCSVCHGDEKLGHGSGSVFAHRLRVFADIFLGDHVYSLVEVQSDHGESPTTGRPQFRVEQAYVRAATKSGAWGVQLGLFASPFGSYALRHLTVADPFLRPPLMYDYRTLMSRTVVPNDVASLLDWRNDPEGFRRTGAPPVWAVPYQWGGMGFARVAGVDVRVAAVNSSPSSAPDAWGFDMSRLRDPSWVVAARKRPNQDFDVGVSWSRGPWMEPFTSGTVKPPGSAPGAAAPGYQSFDQEIMSADVTFARGSSMLRAEVMLDHWSVPNIASRPTEILYNLEAQRDVAAGLFVAGRLGYIDFRPLSTQNGGAVDWDHDVARIEASCGYRLARNAGILISAFQQVQTVASDADGRLVGIRLWWGF